jgi:hypothetical protein
MPTTPIKFKMVIELKMAAKLSNVAFLFKIQFVVLTIRKRPRENRQKM